MNDEDLREITRDFFVTDNPKPFLWFLSRPLDPPPIFKLLQPHSLGDIPTPIESLLYGRWITFWDMRKRSIDIASMYPNIIGRGACL